MLSGVSPCGTCQTSSPRSRLIADSTPYGGFTIGSPCTVRPALGPSAASLAGAASGCCCCGRCGASAAQQSPGPITSRNSCPASPDTYPMSENPFGGATSDRAPTAMLPACANTVCVSGSAADPGQLVAVDATMAP